MRSSSGTNEIGPFSGAAACALGALGPDPDDAALGAIPAPPEQAEADRLHAELDAVRTRDLWPRHLYRDGV